MKRVSQRRLAQWHRVYLERELRHAERRAAELDVVIEHLRLRLLVAESPPAARVRSHTGKDPA